MAAIGERTVPTRRPGGERGTVTVDAAALAAALRERTSGEVRFDEGAQALYATDASNFRQVPIGVVLPRSVDDVIAAVAACREFGAPILARGGGTSLAGQCCNAAVVLDMSKHMQRVLEIDPGRKLARVQPGVVLDDLRDAAERHHLTFGPDPATHNRCTLGGMIGNDSCGAHSVMAGKTVDNIEALDILTYDGLRLRVGATGEEELARMIAEGGRRGEIYAGLRALRDRYADLIRTRYPNIPRRVSGFNLDQLLPEHGFHVARALVGSEGTCVTVLEATCNLVHSPPVRTLVVLGYPDAPAAADHVMEVLAHGPTALEGFDDTLTGALRQKGMYLAYVNKLPKGNGWLLVEFGGETREEAEAKARGLMAALRQQPHPPEMLMPGPHEAHQFWQVRESGLGGTALVPGKGQFWPGWEDSAVPPERLGGYLRDLRQLFERHGYEGAFYGHYGQGCIHTRINFDLTSAGGIATYRRFMEDAADLVVRYGGSLSGEHGDGQQRAELLPKMYGPELVRAFGEFKALWDPAGKMNPGKVVEPYALDQHLRLGASYNPWTPKTHFAFPEDGGSFARAALRCVGVGKCRRHEAGTMCPSYMATREEQHSTRGRARLLFEMLQGNPLEDGWRSETVKEALDLCLACKGCRAECPVQVDMATYKAEFLSHYYEGKRRPIVAYSMGLIYLWARLAAVAPGLANFATHAPLLRAVAKRAAGIAQARAVPAFAPYTFQKWWAGPHPPAPPLEGRGASTEGARQHASVGEQGSSGGRRPEARLRSSEAPPYDGPAGDGQADGAALEGGAGARAGARRVILWPDTFNNHFHPETAIAAVEVLEAAGFAVTVPARPVCCGRPLYDFGMLDRAKALLQDVLTTLRPEIRAGVPVVGLEPSCVSVFRDEMTNLLPHDEDAQRLKRQVFTLGEFLQQHAKDWQPPQLRGKALLHGHCHHKSVLSMAGEEDVLKRLGLDYQYLDDGCCGMAGAFGFEREKYDVSMAVGERKLLPAVRQADTGTLVIADGFSCREQIAQGTPRRALHLAQVLQLALRGAEGAPAMYPERAYPDYTEQATAGSTRLAALAGAGLLASGLAAGALALVQRRRSA